MPQSAPNAASGLNPPLRRNRIKEDLANGRALLGTTVTIANNPAISVLLAATGLDYIELDLEHSSMSTEVLADIVVAARAADLPAIIRPGRRYHGTYGPFLEAGAWGLCLEINSVRDAMEVVRATRHAPLGLRGTFEPGPQNDYQADPQDLTALNAQVHITALLGSAEACEQAEEILAIQGIDAVELDCVRLSHDLGSHSGALERVRAGIVDAAVHHGKIVSASAESEAELTNLAMAGIRMLRYRSDRQVLLDGFAHAIEAATEIREKQS